MNFLLQLLRMLHTVMGITPAEPKDERRYLLLWTVAFLVIILITAGVAWVLIPRIMH